LTLLLFFFSLWLGFLALEAVRLARWQDRIPLRITVTGTRGKSSVVKLLAATLREDGWEVLAKTTGSEAVLILPNGDERRVPRKGRPSILEQIGVLGLAARLGTDALVAEVMSVHSENRMVESQRMIKPHLVLVTNFRVDHVEAQGGTRGEVAHHLSVDVPPGARVLVPESQLEAEFRTFVEGVGGRLDVVPDGPTEGFGGRSVPVPFRPNLALVRAAAEVLGVEEDVVDRVAWGYARSVGICRSWDYPVPGEDPFFRVVDGFAANDPESTLSVLDEFLRGDAALGGGGEDPIGLLSLRKDRGDRSLLWAEVLSRGALDRFGTLYIHGLHAHALRRRLRRAGGPPLVVLRQKDPAQIMNRVRNDAYRAAGRRGTGRSFLFGFGNMGGLGERLVRHWKSVGRPKFPTASSKSPGGTHGV